MRLSRWCHIFKRGEVTAVVHSLTLAVVYVPTKELDMFLSSRNFEQNKDEKELVQLLLSEKMIYSDQDTSEQEFIKVREKLQSEISLEMLYLLVTDGCNLECTYCFEETPPLNGSFRALCMSRETVIRAIDLFSEMTANHGNPQKEKVIHLYGGEPLVNRKAVYEAIFYAEKLKKKKALPEKSRIAIVTNGVLLTENDARFFSAHNVTVGLSIDGPASITDFYRISKRKGVLVSERITVAFRLLKRYGINVGLSVTLTPKAVEHFDEFLNFFTSEEFRQANGLSLNLLHFTPNLNLSDKYYYQAVECQIKAFERFREIGFYEERLMRKVRSFINQIPMYADCGVVGNQLVIAPDGRIGVCPDYVKPRTYFPHSVYDVENEHLREALFAQWRNRSPFFLPQCKGCPAIGICGGGCPASAELKTGSRYNLDERACYHSKRILEWLVWDSYDKLGG